MNRNCIAWLNINCVGYNCPAFNANSISWNLTGTPCNNQAINNGLKSDFFSLLKLRSYHSSGSNSGLVFMEISAKVFMKDIVLWQHFGRSENINSSEKRDTREVNKYHLMMLMLHIFYLKSDLIIKSEENGARTNIFPQFTYWVAKYTIHMLSGQIWNRINLIFVLEMIFHISHFGFQLSFGRCDIFFWLVQDQSWDLELMQSWKLGE